MDEVRPEEFVAGFHIREVQVGEHVGEEGQEFVSDGMPEEENPVGLTALEATAVDNVGKAGDNRLEEVIEFLRIILQIGILNNQVFAGGAGDAGVKGSAFALVDFMNEVLDIQFRVGSTVAGHGTFGIIGRAIVYDDQFLGDSIDQFDAPNLIKDEVDRPLFVVGGNDNGKFGDNRHREAGS